MEFMLQLEDALAEELRQQASNEHTSVEDFAHRRMSQALSDRIAAKRWAAQNRRRLELIAKKLKGPCPPRKRKSSSNCNHSPMRGQPHLTGTYSRRPPT